jgi:56kDa selenium binding protein (SBP56)
VAAYDPTGTANDAMAVIDTDPAASTYGTVGPDGIYLYNLGGAIGNDGPGGVALLDHDSFDVIGAWELDRGDQYFAHDGWWHLDHDT